MKNGIIIVGSAFAVALAYTVGSRLSNEAIAVVVGAVCGISASIPVSIALVIASNNNWGNQSRETTGYGYDQHRLAPQPPIVIVSPPQMPTPYGYNQNPYYFPTPAQTTIDSRDFKNIGGE